MADVKTKFKVSTFKYQDEWSFGLFVYYKPNEEAYLYIDLFKWNICIGFLYY